MTEKIIIAGSGGQGIMLLGKIIALAGLKENKQVSWIPAYGAEVRGGTAYCMVILSDAEISSPLIDKADTLMIMNELSWKKFKHKIENKGLMIINSSLVKNVALKGNPPVKKISGRFTDMATQLGNIKVTNMVALGAYLGKKKIISPTTVVKVIEEIAPADKRHLIEINKQALFAGVKLDDKS